MRNYQQFITESLGDRKIKKMVEEIEYGLESFFELIKVYDDPNEWSQRTDGLWIGPIIRMWDEPSDPDTNLDYLVEIHLNAYAKVGQLGSGVLNLELHEFPFEYRHDELHQMIEDIRVYMEKNVLPRR